MATLLHIAATPQTGNANSLLGKGVAANSDGLLAFLNLMAGQADAAQSAQGGQDIAAKIAEILKNNPADQTSLVSLLQKLFPNATADQLQQAVASLQATPDAASGSDAVKPSLTRDLSAPFAADVQEDPDLLSQLQQKFDALLQDGPVTPDKLAHFRKDAIDFLKDKGLDRATIDSYLVSLATGLGDQLTTPLAAQLGMPVPPQAVASAQAAASESDDAASSDASQPAAAPSAPQTEEASGIEPATGDMTGLDFAQQQMEQAASASADASVQAPPDETVDNNMSRQGTQASVKADNAPAAQSQPQPQDNAPAAKPQPTAAHLSIINSFAQGDTGYENGDSPSQMFQNGNGPMGLTGMLHAADHASPQSFVNYMTSANVATATPTTQMVAIQMQRSANAGIDTFTMQLEPAELGRLEVRMKFNRDGGMKAHLIADKPETLSLLQQDSQALHRILSQAGIDADSNSLTFDLRQQGQQQNLDQSSSGAGQRGGNDALASTAPDVLQAKIAVEAMGYIRQGGINIMV